MQEKISILTFYIYTELLTIFLKKLQIVFISRAFSAVKFASKGKIIAL
jgi:hypothetical protein